MVATLGCNPRLLGKGDNVSGYIATSMAREGRGRIKDRSSTEHPKVFLYIPTEVARDTAFPFDWRKGDEVIVRIDGSTLVVQKTQRADKVRTKNPS